MKPRIEYLPETKLIGMHLSMSMADNQTGLLWRTFMPRRKEVTNAINTDLYSLQVFDPSFDFQIFNPDAVFEKWAAIAVDALDEIPPGMESFVLPAGLYAVFLHKGAAATGAQTFQYIFGTWLPNSEYALDQRPHFELLGEKYKNDDPASEEDIWIPIRPKN